MNALLEAQKKVSEARSAHNALLAVEDTPIEALEASTKTLEGAEVRFRAVAVSQEDTPEKTMLADGEGKELRSLVGRASFGRMLAGIAEDAQGNGAERELRQAFDMGDNYIPLAMFEKRAAIAVTGDESNNQLPWIQRVFPASVAAFAGVDVVTANVGEQTVPVVGTGMTIEFPGVNTAPAESAPTATITTLSPRGARGFVPVAKEDLIKFPGLEDSFRMEMESAIQDAIDLDLLTLANKGLLQLGNPSDPADATTAAEYLAAVYAGVDGVYAAMPNQIRMVVGSTIYTHMAGLAVNTGSATEQTVAEKIAGVSGGIMVSGNVPAYASDEQSGLIIKGGPRRNAVGVMWNGIEVLIDSVTQASKGQLVMHVAAFWDFEVLRSAGYIRHRFRNS